MSEPVTPIKVPWGQSFSVIVDVGEDLAPGFFANWTPRAQLRRYNNRLPSGLLAELTIDPVNPAETNHYLLTALETWDWPVGKAELDITFTNPGVGGQVLRTLILPVEVLRGVTQNG